MADIAASIGATGTATVRRPRVASMLAAAWKRRTTLVVADGGYGKTTALREVAAAGESSWVTIRPSDGLIDTLSARLAVALGAPPRTGTSGLALATGADDRRGLAERRAAMLCERAERRRADLLLVLDDLESLGDDDTAGDLLRMLCLAAPPPLHIVLCGRRLPALGLSAARARGEVLEVSAPDLAFTLDETRSLLTARLGPPAAPMAEECWSLTGGWRPRSSFSSTGSSGCPPLTTPAPLPASAVSRCASGGISRTTWSPRSRSGLGASWRSPGWRAASAPGCWTPSARTRRQPTSTASGSEAC